MDLKESDILGEKIAEHWYYRAKANAMSRLLGKITPTTILDVGAGSGFFSKYLLSHSTATSICCIDTSYERDSDEYMGGSREPNIHYRRSIGAIDADLILLMDVLEHVDNDVELLQEYISKVSPGAHFLISVPAFSFLWSGHDIFLEHKRRYTLPQIEQVANDAGLAVLRGSYYFGAVFPFAAITRIINNILPTRKPPSSQLKSHPPMTNKLLLKICELELPISKYNRLAGLSAFCLAYKPID